MPSHRLTEAVDEAFASVSTEGELAWLCSGFGWLNTVPR